MGRRLIGRGRIVFLALTFAVLLAVYFVTLYKLQMSDGTAYYDSAAETFVTQYKVTAARGNIYDRNGTLLASSKTSYNLMLSRTALLRAENTNAELLGIINTAEEFGVSYTDTFPMTRTGPFEFSASMTAQQRSRLDAYFEYFKLDADISGSDFFIWMKDHYGIGYTTPLADARKIIGLRWELEIRVIVNTDEYVFARGVSGDVISAMLERGYAGVYTVAATEREYLTSSAAHLIGYIGAIPSEDSEKYLEQGYPLNAQVGVSGAEAAFESRLHGTDGVMTVTTNSAGAVVGTETAVAPEAGDNVYLSIDIGLQTAAEKALASTISELNEDRSGSDLAEGGALAVIDVRSGQLLAGANYPGYDLSTVYESFAALNSDGLRPLYNRLTLGKYEPGSTFKMVTSFAALKKGVITPYTTIKDRGRYTKYSDYQPVCWIYPYGDHGTLDVAGAIANSCNYFFYSVGDRLGADAMEDTALLFGLGEKTGIEIEESAGTLGTPEYKKTAVGESWYAADTLCTAIGQGYNLFTPLQICNYIAAVANGGTLYRVSLLSGVTSHDGAEVLYSETPEVRRVIDDEEGYIGVLRSGMRAVAKTGTAKQLFSNYSPAVAAKTGTVESDSARMNNGVFVCYAPADDPEIAISVVVEKGGSGSAIMSAAKSVLDYYFADADYDAVYTEGGLS